MNITLKYDDSRAIKVTKEMKEAFIKYAKNNPMGEIDGAQLNSLINVLNPVDVDIVSPTVNNQTHEQTQPVEPNVTQNISPVEPQVDQTISPAIEPTSAFTEPVQTNIETPVNNEPQQVIPDVQNAPVNNEPQPVEPATQEVAPQPTQTNIDTPVEQAPQEPAQTNIEAPVNEPVEPQDQTITSEQTNTEPVQTQIEQTNNEISQSQADQTIEPSPVFTEPSQTNIDTPVEPAPQEINTESFQPVTQENINNEPIQTPVEPAPQEVAPQEPIQTIEQTNIESPANEPVEPQEQTTSEQTNTEPSQPQEEQINNIPFSTLPNIQDKPETNKDEIETPSIFNGHDDTLKEVNITPLNDEQQNVSLEMPVVEKEPIEPAIEDEKPKEKEYGFSLDVLPDNDNEIKNYAASEIWKNLSKNYEEEKKRKKQEKPKPEKIINDDIIEKDKNIPLEQVKTIINKKSDPEDETTKIYTQTGITDEMHDTKIKINLKDLTLFDNYDDYVFEFAKDYYKKEAITRKEINHLSQVKGFLQKKDFEEKRKEMYQNLKTENKHLKEKINELTENFKKEIQDLNSLYDKNVDNVINQTKYIRDNAKKDRVRKDQTDRLNKFLAKQVKAQVNKINTLTKTVKDLKSSNSNKSSEIKSLKRSKKKAKNKLKNLDK